MELVSRNKSAIMFFFFSLTWSSLLILCRKANGMALSCELGEGACAIFGTCLCDFKKQKPILPYLSSFFVPPPYSMKSWKLLFLWEIFVFDFSINLGAKKEWWVCYAGGGSPAEMERKEISVWKFWEFASKDVWIYQGVNSFSNRYQQQIFFTKMTVIKSW